MAQPGNNFTTLYDQLPQDKQIGFAKLICLLSENPDLLNSLAHEQEDSLLNKLRVLVEALSKESGVGA